MSTPHPSLASLEDFKFQDMDTLLPLPFRHRLHIDQEGIERIGHELPIYPCLGYSQQSVVCQEESITRYGS